MRPIKFRGWDLEKKQMRLVVSIDWSDNEQGGWVPTAVRLYKGFGNPIDLVPASRVELLEATGLHDKHGTEMFDSDRVRWDGVEYIIKWSGFHGWILKNDREDWNCPNLYAVSSPEQTRIEIIGNVYET